MYNTQGFFGANPPLFLEFPVIPEECDDSWHEMLQSHSKSKGMEDFWYIKKHAHICQTGIQRVKKQYVNYFFWIFPIQQHAKRGVCTSWKVCSFDSILEIFGTAFENTISSLKKLSSDFSNY